MGLGITPNFWVYISIMGLMGIAAPLYNAPVMVMLQSNVEPEFMGRVLSVFTMVTSAMMPLAMLFFGPIADTVNIDAILIATGCAIVLLSVFIITSKTLRRVGGGGNPARAS
jgi:DHA3 family macrolide efflux protein-like MFS transporter